HVSNEFVETFESEISFSSWLDGCDERPVCENRIIEQVFRSRVRTEDDSVVLFVQLVGIPEPVMQEFESRILLTIQVPNPCLVGNLLRHIRGEVAEHVVTRNDINAFSGWFD